MGPKRGQSGKNKGSKNLTSAVPGSEHIVFGRDGEKDKQKGESSKPETAPRPDSRKIIGGASWTGKLPVNLLSELCQRQKWNKPEYSMRQMAAKEGDDRKYRSAVMLSKTDPKSQERICLPQFRLPPEQESLGDQLSALEARHFAAAYALYRVSSMKNIHLTLPPQYRDLWKGDFERMKIEDSKEGRGWKYEADPFAADLKRKEIHASMEKRKQEITKQDHGPSQLSGPMPVRGSQERKQWERAPRIELGQAVRAQMEALVRTKALWNPTHIKMSPTDNETAIERLSQSGFRKSHVKEAFENCGSAEEALEWLLIHVPEDDLPAWSLPTAYNAGVTLASGNPAREAVIERLAMAGYAAHLCSQALRENDEDENAAAESLQNSLVPSSNIIPLLNDCSTKDDDVWGEEMTTLHSIFDERMSVKSSTYFSISCTAVPGTSMTVHFRKPSRGYPDEAVPIVSIESKMVPAYIRLLSTKNAVIYAQKNLLGAQMLFNLVEWLETEMPNLMQNPGKLVDVDIKVPSFKKWKGLENAVNHNMSPSKSGTRQSRAPRDTRTSETILMDWKTRQRSSKHVEMNAFRKTLPAALKESDILEAVHNRQVTLITGETGSGKSTQAVQFILDDAIRRNQGASANLVCTQPRRVAALSLSDRVSAERCTPEGDEVGYIIRGDSKISSKTKVTFMTTGVLLRRLQRSSSLKYALNGISHVFVDEVHERSVETDFLLALLRDAIKGQKELKIILMSATVNAELFSSYFGGDGIVSRVHIEGRTFPVQDYYLDTVLQLVNPGKIRNSADIENEQDTDIGKSIQALGRGINYELIASLVECIDTELGDAEGGILIFLPGTLEIDRCLRSINHLSNIHCLPLHASLQPSEQKRVFSKPPAGRRKVIAATNVAETSITIDDIVAVIDTGRVKETAYDVTSNIVRLQEIWASRAACKQRRGRAGRVSAGKCYKLFTKNVETSMSPMTVPEIQRIPLEQLCLSVKATVSHRDVGDFLASTLSAPDSSAVLNALQLLHRMGALDGERLTGLGMYLAMIPADLRCAKLLVYGILFGCFETCLTVASILAVRSPFVSPREKREEARASRASFSSTDGDLLLDCAAVQKWKELSSELRYQDLRNWCDRNFLSAPTLRDIDSTRQQLIESLKESALIPPSYRSPPLSTSSTATTNGLGSDTSKLNRKNSSNLLLRALIAGCLNPQIAEIKFPDKKYIASMTGARELDPEARTIKYFTEPTIPVDNFVNAKSTSQATRGDANGQDNLKNPRGGARVFLHPSSILFDVQNYSTGAVNYLSYFTKLASGTPIKPYIKDLTPLNPYSLLLFCGPITLDTSGSGLLVVDGWLRLRGWARIGVLVSRLRAILDQELKRRIEGETDINDNGDEVMDLVERLVELNGADQ